MARSVLWLTGLLLAIGLGWILGSSRAGIETNDPVDFPEAGLAPGEGNSDFPASIERGRESTLEIAAGHKPTGSELNWWDNPEKVQALRELWPEVHSWNLDARVKEFAERQAGTGILTQTLELAGNLLEEIPLDISDFQHVEEPEKAAISSVLQFACNRRVEFGKDPSNSLKDEELQRLFSDVQLTPLYYPTHYLPDALGVNYASLPFAKREELTRLRVDYLKRLAPIVADEQHRLTSAVHLLSREGLMKGFQPSQHMHILDPTATYLDQQMLLIEAEYRDAVSALIVR